MYDAIVVGARCAGSPVAMLLARQGYRILLLDRASFPSNTMRNHFIQESASDSFSWGLLPAVVASNCPPIRCRHQRLRRLPPARAGRGRRRHGCHLCAASPCPGQDPRGCRRGGGRRAAREVSVQPVLRRDGRVVGVRGRGNGGTTVDEYAQIVIGADGAHSTVAEAVQAPRYHERPVLTY